MYMRTQVRAPASCGKYLPTVENWACEEPAIGPIAHSWSEPTQKRRGPQEMPANPCFLNVEQLSAGAAVLGLKELLRVERGCWSGHACEDCQCQKGPNYRFHDAYSFWHRGNIAAVQRDQ
jgi:hypothetical protein